MGMKYQHLMLRTCKQKQAYKVTEMLVCCVAKMLEIVGIIPVFSSVNPNIY